MRRQIILPGLEGKCHEAIYRTRNGHRRGRVGRCAGAPARCRTGGRRQDFCDEDIASDPNDSTHQFSKNLAAAVERDSGGRIKAEIYPSSQLGAIPRQIEGTQFGAIQCEVLPPEFFAGIDERFEVSAAPGIVDSMEHGQRLAADPAVVKLMLGLGADKGLHGAGLMMVNPSSLITKTPVRHLADLKGKKIRVLASQFQMQALNRLGATPVAMTLGDVLPALQQGAIDGAISALNNFTAMHFGDASKYVTEIGQPAIFAVIEISKKWYDTLPVDLQQVVEQGRGR